MKDHVIEKRTILTEYSTPFDGYLNCPVEDLVKQLHKLKKGLIDPVVHFGYECDRDYGGLGHEFTFEVRGYRPMTAEEKKALKDAARKRRESERARQQAEVEAELEELDRLAKKHGKEVR